MEGEKQGMRGGPVAAAAAAAAIVTGTLSATGSGKGRVRSEELKKSSFAA